MAVKDQSELIADLRAWSASFETKQPQEVVAAVIERYQGKMVLACSFGAENVVLVDMGHGDIPSHRCFYFDTEFLFPEPYATQNHVIS